MNKEKAKKIAIVIKVAIFLAGCLIFPLLKEMKIGAIWIVLIMWGVLWALFYDWKVLLLKNSISSASDNQEHSKKTEASAGDRSTSLFFALVGVITIIVFIANFFISSANRTKTSEAIAKCENECQELIKKWIVFRAVQGIVTSRERWIAEKEICYRNCLRRNGIDFEVKKKK